VIVTGTENETGIETEIECETGIERGKETETETAIETGIGHPEGMETMEVEVLLEPGEAGEETEEHLAIPPHMTEIGRWQREWGSKIFFFCVSFWWLFSVSHFRPCGISNSVSVCIHMLFIAVVSLCKISVLFNFDTAIWSASLSRTSNVNLVHMFVGAKSSAREFNIYLDII